MPDGPLDLMVLGVDPDHPKQSDKPDETQGHEDPQYRDEASRHGVLVSWPAIESTGEFVEEIDK